MFLPNLEQKDACTACRQYVIRACVLQGFEIGSGFEGSRMLGSDHNDEFYMADGEVRTRTNRSDQFSRLQGLLLQTANMCRAHVNDLCNSSHACKRSSQ